MRAVRNAARMESDGGFLDALAAGKMAANVEEDFIRLNVGMSPRNADGFGMGVQHARSERAHDKSRSVECLMDRRRLVKCPGDRLEIIGIECVWIKHAIPADHIARMMSQRVSSQSSAVLD